ncbi:Gldg family protein [Trichothermofontia sichuanensis B231]|uniref:GldG family protein n=1 Tax=Trichothermofontia sichuanensis TaxID=3045816 RepID=UPI0022456813|nr:Gldg family protein [Trichothermofontia sichuanensis]UZQ55840.1 Gldg family protein [Trichothermofontia sichuanensis B231]
MKTKRWQGSKYLPSVFWLGPISLIIGVSAGVVAGTWVPIPLMFLIGGGILIAGWLWWQTSATTGFWGRRSTQAGTNALLSTLAVLVILGLINFLAVRYSARFDLTETQFHSLSPQSQEVVRALEQPVKVWVFTRPPNAQDQALLQNYRRNNPRQFQFEFVDPQQDPALARRFQVTAPGDVYLEMGDRKQFVQNLQNERLSESRLTNSLLRTTEFPEDYVYFLQGQGQRSLDQFSQAVTRLGDENFSSEPLNIAQRIAAGQPPIPENATVIVLAGAQRALFPQEVDALKAFLDRGGGLLVMADPNTDPGLDRLLEEWGVTLDPRLVIDATGGAVGLDASGGIVGFGPTAPLVTDYGTHPITANFRGGNSFFPSARPLRLTPKPNVEQTELLLTNAQSWAESDLSQRQVEFNPGPDTRGPLILGAALSRPATQAAKREPTPPATPSPSPSPSPGTPEAKADDAKTQPQARLVVIGNSGFATDGFFNQQLNGDVFLNSVNWLSNREGAVLSIRPRETTDRRLILTPARSRWVTLLALVILPIVGLAAAIGVWWRRR